MQLPRLERRVLGALAALRLRAVPAELHHERALFELLLVEAEPTRPVESISIETVPMTPRSPDFVPMREPRLRSCGGAPVVAPTCTTARGASSVSVLARRWTAARMMAIAPPA